MTRFGSCLPGCGKCCEFMEMDVNPVYASDPDIRKWVELHGITLITQVSGRVFARLPIPCTALTEDKRCGVHGTEKRPEMCEAWPQSREALAPLATVCGFSFT